MPPKLAKTYELRSNSPEIDGRPCWIQKVRNSKNLYILAQACKPTEKRFPHVETMLISLSPDGKLAEYGSKDTLGLLTDATTPNGKSRSVIEWIDGTNVTWVEIR